MKEQRHNYLIKDKLPSDWDILPIEKIVAKDKGSIKIGPFGSSLKKEYLVKEGYKVYGQENIIEEDFTLGERFIDRERFELLRTNEILPGDIVMSMMGTIGKVLIVPDSIQKGIMDSHLLRIRLDENLMNKDFFIQLFKDYYPTYKQIQRMSVGGIMSGLSSSIIRKIKLPVPPLKEQLKISSILSVWDKAIELKEKLIEQKKEQQKGLMQKLLTGEVRLPGFEGEWIEYQVGEICTLTRGRVISKKEMEENIGIYPVYSSQTSNEGKIGSIDTYDFDGEYVTWTTDGANAGTVFYRNGKFNCTNVCGVLKLKREDIDARYLAYVLASNTGRYVVRHGNPKLMNNIMEIIPVKIFNNFEFQKYICDFFDIVDKEINLIEKETNELKQQKKGLMQLLLTGKVRVQV